MREIQNNIQSTYKCILYTCFTKFNHTQFIKC